MAIWTRLGLDCRITLFFITKHISTGPMDASPVDPPPLMQHCPSSSSSDSVLTTSSISSDKENIHPVQRQPPEPQSPDIPLPPLQLPLEKTEITSYSVLVRHLKQSDLIFDAFQKKFGMT